MSILRNCVKVEEAANFLGVHVDTVKCLCRAGRIVVIPDHGSQVIVRHLLRKIIRDIGLSIEKYHNILEKI